MSDSAQPVLSSSAGGVIAVRLGAESARPRRAIAMELAYRSGADTFVPAGSYRRLRQRLAERGALADVSAVVLACFDRRTRLLPFVLYDHRIFPAGVRTVAGALAEAGCHTRAVFQLWNPNFRPSRARLGGRPPQLLLVSTMGINAAEAYRMVADAWELGDERPLILVGGPKTSHEAEHFWALPPTPRGPAAPDAAVTGEVYILLDLLNVLSDYRRPGEHLR